MLCGAKQTPRVRPPRPTLLYSITTHLISPLIFPPTPHTTHQHHQALQQYEEEQEAVRKQGYARNPLVRDQATLIIDKVWGCLGGGWGSFGSDGETRAIQFRLILNLFIPYPQSYAKPPQGDASNRRWLSGAPEGAGSTSNWAEREAMAQKERLSGVEGTIVRCACCFLGLVGQYPTQSPCLYTHTHTARQNKTKCKRRRAGLEAGMLGDTGLPDEGT